MDKPIRDFYNQPNIGEYEDVHLLTLSEQCAALEERVLAIAAERSPYDREVIEEYINTRNDLEVETIKTALRWGKQHYK